MQCLAHTEKVKYIANLIEELSMKKIPITYNIFFCDTSPTSVAEEEGPVAEEDTLAHLANTPTLSPLGEIRLRVWELQCRRVHKIESA